MYNSRQSNSYLNGVLPLGEVDLALPLLLGDPGGLVLGETAAQLTGELGAKVEREVLLVLVEQTQLSALVGVDDGENTSDGLANVAAVGGKPVSNFEPSNPGDSFVQRFRVVRVVRRACMVHGVPLLWSIEIVPLFAKNFSMSLPPDRTTPSFPPSQVPV